MKYIYLQHVTFKALLGLKTEQKRKERKEKRIEVRLFRLRER